MANPEVQQYILRAIQNATGDDLERARAAFKGLTPEVMAQEYGCSGRSRQSILDSHEHERKLNEMARAYVQAAPDMYAALEAFIEAWDKSHQLEKTDVAYRMARESLAKAGRP